MNENDFRWFVIAICFCVLIQTTCIIGVMGKMQNSLEAMQKALEQKNNLTLDKPLEKDYREPQSYFTED
jgi:cell division protein FtsB